MNLKAERQSGGERPFCTKITQGFKGIGYSAGKKKKSRKKKKRKKKTPVLENKQNKPTINGELGIPPNFVVTGGS